MDKNKLVWNGWLPFQPMMPLPGGLEMKEWLPHLLRSGVAAILPYEDEIKQYRKSLYSNPNKEK